MTLLYTLVAGGMLAVELATVALVAATLSGTELGVRYSASDVEAPGRGGTPDMEGKEFSAFGGFFNAGVSSMISRRLSAGERGLGLDGRDCDCFSICKKFGFPSP